MHADPVAESRTSERGSGWNAPNDARGDSEHEKEEQERVDPGADLWRRWRIASTRASRSLPPPPPPPSPARACLRRLGRGGAGLEEGLVVVLVLLVLVLVLVGNHSESICSMQRCLGDV